MRRAGAAKKAREGRGKGASKRAARPLAKRARVAPGAPYRPHSQLAAKSEVGKRSRLLGWLQLPLFGPSAPPAPPPPARATAGCPGSGLPRRVEGRIPEAAVQALAVRLTSRMPLPAERAGAHRQPLGVALHHPRNSDGGLRLRLHRAFVEAERRGAHGGGGLRRGRAGQAPPGGAQPACAPTSTPGARRAAPARHGAAALSARCVPTGDVHNLVAIREDLNRKLFSGKLAPGDHLGPLVLARKAPAHVPPRQLRRDASG